MQLADDSPRAKGKILNHDAGLGEAGKEDVERRARELAEIAGIGRDESIDDFRLQAREELRGSLNPNIPTDDEGPAADLVAEDDVAGESGREVSAADNPAAYGDEQTVGEQLYGEGIDEADHDRMTQSRQEERRNEQV